MYGSDGDVLKRALRRSLFAVKNGFPETYVIKRNMSVFPEGEGVRVRKILRAITGRGGVKKWPKNYYIMKE